MCKQDANPILSVIVPVYKVEQYLPTCIESILRQTLRDLELILVDDGSPDGPEKSSLVRKSRDLERISFVGFQEPGEWYRRSAIFCMTSNFEGWGMVLVEAMSQGVVPLAFDSYASVHDIIDDGRNGFLVTPFSINEYAEKLAKLMDDDAQRERMSRNCLHGVQRYSKENVVNQWEQLFKELKS